MSRNEIIAALFVGKNFNECINKMDPEHLRDDLRQEVIAIVCEWPEEKVKGLHDRRELEFFVVRVILNQIKSSSSPFAKKYRQIHYRYADDPIDVVGDDGHGLARISRMMLDQLPDQIDLDDRLAREEMEDRALIEVDNQYWYNKELIQLYAKHGNFRAIQKATGIPFVSCYKTIKKSLNDIKLKVS